MAAKPKTEVDLENLQTIYLKTKDPDAWKKMYEVLILYARSLALKMTKNRKFLDPDHVQAVAIDAASKFMSRYLEQDDFIVTASFGGLLKWKVLETLYSSKQRNVDSELSLNAALGDGTDHSTELGELTERFHLSAVNSHNESYEPEFDHNSEQDFFQVVQKTLKDFDEIAPYHLRMIARPYILMYIRKPRLKNWKESFEKVYTLGIKEIKALESLVEEISNRFKL